MALSKYKLIKCFNDNHKEIVEKLKDPDTIAGFLFTNYRHLNAEKVGLILGGEKNEQILAAYLKLFNFAQLTITQALTTFLATFKLPGEAQIISRIMEVFTKELVAQKFGQVESLNEEQYFSLSFAIIILNTNLHNPSVSPENKMTLEQFVKQLKGANIPLKEEDIRQIYFEIKTTPFKLEISGIKSGIIIHSKHFNKKNSAIGFENSNQTEGCFELSDGKKLFVHRKTSYNFFLRFLLGAHETLAISYQDKEVAEVTLYYPSFIAMIFRQNERVHIKPLGYNPNNIVLSNMIAQHIAKTCSNDPNTKLVIPKGLSDWLRVQPKADSSYNSDDEETSSESKFCP